METQKYELLLDALFRWGRTSLGPIVKAAVVFAIGWFLIRLAMKALARMLTRTKIEVTLHAFILSLARISLTVLLAISCAVMSNLVEATSIVTALGAVGLAISLAVKDGLTDVAGGISVLAAKPFSVGDYISTDCGIEGTVERIDLVHTMLKTIDNKLIYVPNGKMSSAIVTNYTAQEQRRLDLDWTLGYHTDAEQARAELLAIIEAHPDAIHDPAPFVRLTKLGESAIVLTSRVWVLSDRYWDMRYDVLEQGKRRLDELGITFAYPQLDVHVKQ